LAASLYSMPGTSTAPHALAVEHAAQKRSHDASSKVRSCSDMSTAS
jgi:hypothetical protein